MNDEYLQDLCSSCRAIIYVKYRPTVISFANFCAICRIANALEMIVEDLLGDYE